MAFGFGFNKQKVLSAAEKFVQQGKLPNAISEYEKILKADPKDLTVMNTVGDLYSRLGDNDKAIECFKSVGDAYASQGFTVKAIAMYKKITKSKPSVESVLRLAELYTQQGLFNDARAQYLQVAEEFLRGGELDQAVRIFQKTLEMDPENLAMRLRLAEVYVRLGKKEEARQVYSAAVESLKAKGQHDAAEEILQRLVKLDPGSSDAVLMRARNAMDAGDFTSAAQQFEQIRDIDHNPDALRGLFQAYLNLGRLNDAGAIAPKLFPLETNCSSISSYVDALIAAGQYEEALPVYQTYAERLLADNSTRFLNSLHSMIGPLSENTGALEAILSLLGNAGDKSHDAEIFELLGHAYVQSGVFEKARDCYAELMQLEPQNTLHAQNYQQVAGRITSAATPSLISVEEGVVWVDELEATAPFIDQENDDSVAAAVRTAITDAELFLSYNMQEKALAPLLSVLPQAPRDLRLNQRLAALHTRAARFAEAAVCCRTLESIYHDAGNSAIAARYGDLAAKYEAYTANSEGESSAVVAAPEVAEFEAPVEVVVPEAVVEPQPQAQAAAASAQMAAHVPTAPVSPEPAEFSVQAVPSTDEAEIDLSGEWDGNGAVEEAAPAPEAAVEPEAVPASASSNDLAVAETIEEIRFYLENSMPDQAKSAMGKLESLTSDPAMLTALRAEIEAAAAAVPAVEPELAVVADDEPAIVVEEAAIIPEAPVVPEIPLVPEAVVEELVVEAPPAPLAEIAAPEPVAQVPAPVAPAPKQASVPAPAPGVLNDIVADLESSLGDSFLPDTSAQPMAEKPAPPVAPAATPKPKPQAPAIVPPTAENDTLGDLVSDLESSLGDSFLAEAPATQPTAAAAAPVPPPPSAPIAAMSAAASASSAMSQPQAPVQPPVPASKNTANTAAAGFDLADMFGELKQELEEDTAQADEDPETHYSLGVAFREMGLLDEAIGELQKVCTAVERGHQFGSLMQTYTWLAQCFLDKGVPEAAVRWYDKALQLPNLDGETLTALHYELASASEGAGDKATALTHFMQVYGSNIDYRDVAERIKALKS